MISDNPASRLCSILEYLQSIVRELDKNDDMDEAWRMSLPIIGNESREGLHSQYAKVLSLVGQVTERVINENPSLENVARQWEEGIYQVLLRYRIGGEKARYFVGAISGHMPFLAVAATLLEKGVTPKKVELSDIEELIGSFNSMLINIGASDEISPEVKAYLNLAIRRVIKTLKDYRVTGGTVVLDALQQLAGGIVLDRNVHTEVQSSSFSDPLTKIITHAAAIVGVTSVAQQILINGPATVEAVKNISGL